VKRADKAAREALAREGVLASHIRASAGPFDAPSLSRSYAVPVERVRAILIRNGGSHAQ
jgi:hypothetical protein